MFIGVDVGRGSTTGVYGSGEKDIINYLSYACPGKKRDIVTSGDDMENLVVSINGQEWFIGNLAKREGGTKEFNKQKGQHGNIKPLLLTSIALAAKEEIVIPRLVPGLPISDYQAQAESFEQSLAGTYNVILPDGKEVYINLKRQNIVAFPECAAAGMDMLLDWDGKLSNHDLAGKTFAIGDIGWKTFNFAVFRGVNFQDSKSGTLPLGLSVAFTEYYKRVSRSRDITISKAEELLFTDGEQELRDLTSKIQDGLSLFWNDILSDVDYMFLVGYAAPRVINYFNWNWQLHPHYESANAMGNYKIAVQQFGDTL